MNLNYACHELEGHQINGWIVLQKLDKPKNVGGTGGNFSVCYIVEKEGQQSFMKVLDFKFCFEDMHPGEDIVNVLNDSTREFIYERKLAEYCEGRHVPKIVKVMDSGTIAMPGYHPIMGRVCYIVFEQAAGDVRKVLRFSQSQDQTIQLNDAIQKLRSLHDVSVGLNQLHMSEVSHQDIKPSNVLVFDDEHKIGDLGRSLCFAPDIECPFDFTSYRFYGDKTYASPEVVFGYYYTRDRNEWFYQIDNYMFGGLIVYYLTSMSINALLAQKLACTDIWQYHQGYAFEDVILDLQNAFQEVLYDLKNEIQLESIREDFIKLVTFLCNPDPKMRGHEQNLKSREANYSLTRIIAQLSLMEKRAERELIELS